MAQTLLPFQIKEMAGAVVSVLTVKSSFDDAVALQQQMLCGGKTFIGVVCTAIVRLEKREWEGGGESVHERRQFAKSTKGAFVKWGIWWSVTEICPS